MQQNRPSNSGPQGRLEKYGWDERFQRVFEESVLGPRPQKGTGHFSGRAEKGTGHLSTLQPGRILTQYSGGFLVVTSDGDTTAEVAGSLRHRSDESGMPAVGDWVALEKNRGGSARIRHILPRRSQFVRQAAGTRIKQQIVGANIDVVFITMGLDGDFNLRRLERYLAAAWESGAQPVILLTKTDLSPDVGQRLLQVQTIGLGVPVHALSPLHGDGVGALKPYLKPATTSAFLGSSGVGKSTLVNRLVGRELKRTREVRADGRGRHTTRRRELILLPGGGLVLDTPGLRELQLWGGEGISGAFEDVEEMSRSCRFSDCSHAGEPGCAIRAAIADGRLDGDRLQAYHRLQREISYQESRRDKSAALAEKRRVRDLHRKYRTIIRDRRRR